MTGSQLVKYDAAIHALAECVRVDEAKGLQDKAAAAQAYARQANDQQLLAYATEIRLRAQRKVGELLIQMKERGERASGHEGGVYKTPGQSQATKYRREAKALNGGGAKPAPMRLEDLEIAPEQAKVWQRLAKMPTREFDEKVAVATGKKSKPKHESSNPTKVRKTRVQKARGGEPSLKQQVNAFHHEAVSLVSDFRDRFMPWFGANAKLTSEQRAVLTEAMQLCSTEFSKMAQAVDGR